MWDLTHANPDDLTASAEPVEVELIDLLNDAVDLTPSRYTAAHGESLWEEYIAARERLTAVIEDITRLLPDLSPGSKTLDAQVKVSDLVDAGLVRMDEGALSSTSDRLNTDYLNGFLRASANARRSTSASGTFRTDVRGAYIPHMNVDDQRSYGKVFQALEEFERRSKEVNGLASQLVEAARTGLTGGSLSPKDLQ